MHVKSLAEATENSDFGLPEHVHKMRNETMHKLNLLSASYQQCIHLYVIELIQFYTLKSSRKISRVKAWFRKTTASIARVDPIFRRESSILLQFYHTILVKCHSI